MAKLTQRLDAVEFVKQHQEATLRRYKMAMVAAFVVGIISGIVSLNFDAGHFFGSTGRNPIEMIEKYHDRIVSIHIKDKTGPNTQPTPNQNQVWGQGEN